MADTPVDVNTDNLDDFNNLLNNNTPVADVSKAGPVADEPVVDPVEDADAPDGTATEPDAVADDVDADAPAEGDEDGDADADAQQDAVEDDAENIFKPKKKQTAKERIDQVVREREELKRGYEARIAALEADRAAPTKQDVPANRAAPADDSDAPHPDALAPDGSLQYPLGEYDPQFLADRTEYLVTKQLAQAEDRRRSEDAERTRIAEDAALTTAWEGKLAEAETELADIRPTIQVLDTEFRNLDPTYGTYLAKTIMDMDFGPQVLYYLANNVDEARTIVASGPQKATLALGRLEARIQTALAKKATPPRTTNAPKPAATTRGNSGASSVRGDTDDLDAFERQLFKKKT